MALTGATGLFVGAVALGFVHGIEPGHGWPVAATYALDRSNKWLYGFAASFILGVGHLISSIAMVGVFFYAKAYFDLTQVNEPITVDLFSTTLFIGGPVSLVAGVVLIALGVREYRHGHSHSHSSHSNEDHDHHEDDDHEHEGHGRTHDRAPDGHDHDGSDDDGHDHDHHTDGGLFARLKQVLPFVGGHSHDHDGMDDAAEKGLWGIAWFAFVLGFAHEEEFEIIALCAGSTRCLELMLAYALTVIAGIVGLTLLLIAGYERYEERVERYAEYLPVFSAAVLIVMGFGFVLGVF